jgi:glycosyltransferase involved in cell wall biosynthesis
VEQQRFRVLIAHQSAIPHYRVPFYRALQRLKPDWWSFAVVYDPEPSRNRRVFVEPVAEADLDFPLERTTTWNLPLVKGVRYQPFLSRARRYDLLVLEDAFNNLTYPLATLLLRRRLPVAFWGHGRDVRASRATGLKRFLEDRKLRWARRAAGFFAYTDGVRDFLVGHGVAEHKIFVLHNTIDIQAHRREFESLRGSREETRRRLGLEGRRVLLYVGRIKRDKKLELLAAAVRDLRRRDPS